MTAREVIEQLLGGGGNPGASAREADDILTALDAAGYVIVPKALPQSVTSQFWMRDSFHEFWAELLAASQESEKP